MNNFFDKNGYQIVHFPRKIKDKIKKNIIDIICKKLEINKKKKS